MNSKPANQTDLNLCLPTNNTQLSRPSQQMMVLMMEMGINPEVIAALLEISAVSINHIRWLAGPIVVQESEWSHTLPYWLRKAIYRDRLEQIFTEIEAGKVGKLATPAEVMACIYPASLDAPMYRDWVDVYLWCGNEVFPKHKRLPKGKTFWQVVGQDPPIKFSSIKQDYHQIAKDIRLKVVQQAQQRGWGKRRQSTISTTSSQNQVAQSNEIVQISLF